ncbi:hypothetical protein OZX57_08285 [Bifidobacterium sp. ESL0682]|uniref:hypothetical protein n=1 Tax=Bifidobacterium sp. ESL0682 TaxID=2983212 RepID=UPI0023F7CD17|nr:hypothetical protein [Bifidobacterium sp. ESL0682]WEV41919.1 hypothetical protein OZX57_08285 [Bifidobacterium sp. ESL0682]
MPPANLNPSPSVIQSSSSAPSAQASSQSSTQPDGTVAAQPSKTASNSHSVRPVSQVERDTGTASGQSKSSQSPAQSSSPSQGTQAPGTGKTTLPSPQSSLQSLGTAPTPSVGGSNTASGSPAPGSNNLLRGSVAPQSPSLSASPSPVGPRSGSAQSSVGPQDLTYTNFQTRNNGTELLFQGTASQLASYGSTTQITWGCGSNGAGGENSCWASLPWYQSGATYVMVYVCPAGTVMSGTTDNEPNGCRERWAALNTDQGYDGWPRLPTYASNGCSSSNSDFIFGWHSRDWDQIPYDGKNCVTNGYYYKNQTWESGWGPSFTWSAILNSYWFRNGAGLYDIAVQPITVPEWITWGHNNYEYRAYPNDDSVVYGPITTLARSYPYGSTKLHFDPNSGQGGYGSITDRSQAWSASGMSFYNLPGGSGLSNTGNRVFTGWNTRADGYGTQYSPAAPTLSTPTRATPSPSTPSGRASTPRPSPATPAPAAHS